MRFWLGEGYGRLDLGILSYLLLDSGRRLVILDHKQEQYQVNSLPFRIEDHVPEGMLEAVRHRIDFQNELSRQVRAGTRIEPTDETRHIGAWQARKHRIEIYPESFARIVQEGELWLTRDVPRRSSRATSNSYPAGFPRPVGLGRSSLALEGVVVLETRVNRYNDGRRKVVTRTLKEIREVERSSPLGDP